MEKTISVERLVRVFKLKVLTEADYLDREVTRANARRPGLEFTKFMDYFPQGHVLAVGDNDIQYVKSVPEKEHAEQAATVVKYGTPSIIGTDGRDHLEYLPKYSKRHHIPLLVTEDTNYEFIRKTD